MNEMVKVGHLRVVRPTLLAAALILLAACVSTPVQPAKPLRLVPLPEAFHPLVVNFSTAYTIALECPKQFSLDTGAFRRSGERFAEANPELRGYSREEFEATALSDAAMIRAQNDIFAYVAKRRINLAKPASWCAAGMFEKANKTAIGAYLIEKP